MRFARYWIPAFSLLLALAAGCASGPTTRVDSNPGIDLNAYKTFAFFEQGPGSRPAYGSLLAEHLKDSARRQLERFGYVYSDTDPDLRVNYFLTVQDRQELRSSPGMGPFGYRAWGNASIETVNYRQGTLVIDLVDAPKKTLVWRGVAEGRVSQKASKNAAATIDSTVAQIFANFPYGSDK